MKIKVVNKSGMALPKYMTDGAACVDLCINERLTIHPKDVIVVGTGLFVEIPKGWCIEIVERSSLHTRGISLANSVGIIDSDYRGEIKLALRSMNEMIQVDLTPGTRVAQAMLKKVEPIEWIEVDSLDDSERGIGGFGSTGA